MASNKRIFSTEVEQKVHRNKQNKRITFRITLLMVSVIVIFTTLISRLVYIQIISAETYALKLLNYQTTYKIEDVPRGLIYDRNGKLLVGNTTQNVLQYYPPLLVTLKDKWEVATLIVKHFNVDETKLTRRDLLDFYIWYSETKQLANDKISAHEWEQYYDKEINDNDIYLLKLSRITDKDLEIFSIEDKKTYLIYTLMNKETGNNLKTIIEDISIEEASFFSENKELFPGFKLGEDWQRYYVYENIGRGLLGSVTTKTQGLPVEKLDYYLGMGYNLNDRVGRSGIEQQYEVLLSGKKTTYTLGYDENKLPVYNVDSLGYKGDDLRLSIDIDLQQEVFNILSETLLNQRIAQPDMEEMYIVMMNPNTGDIYANVGVKVDSEGNIFDNSTGTYTLAFTPGSVIKGATVFAGFNEGVISAGEVIADEPIYLQGTAPKSSWKPLGLVDDIGALKMSSNTYMMKIAMRIGGATYIPNGRLNINTDAFDTFRKYFGNFGLGVKTNVDIPNEAIGYKGLSRSGGLLLDFSFGQYDNYTPMQLAQYVSTIANGGKRIQPRFLIDASATNKGVSTVTYVNTPTILGTLDNHEYAIERVKLGFRENVLSGIGTILRNRSYNPASKTGTAETFTSNGTKTVNYNFVAFAPYENPELAIACMAPLAGGTTNICQNASVAAMDAYFAKK